MDEKVSKLLQLIKENPGLPIVPMVEAEIVEDGYTYYMGEWGYAEVDEYILAQRKWGNEMLLKSDEDVFDVLEKCLSKEEYDALPDDEDECRTYLDNLQWTKAIIVYINKVDEN